MAHHYVAYVCEVCKGRSASPRRLSTARCVHCGSLKTKIEAATIRLDQEPEPNNGQFLDPAPPIKPTPVKPQPKPSVSAVTDLVSRWACVDCARKFEWNHDRAPNQSVTCPSCKSAEVVEVSPRARAFAVVKGHMVEPMTRAEAKRSRFVQRQWRMRCELKEWIEGLDGLLERMALKTESEQPVRLLLGQLLAEVDSRQQQRLAEYQRER